MVNFQHLNAVVHESSESSDSAESSNKIRIRQDSFRQRKFANFQFGSEIRMQHYILACAIYFINSKFNILVRTYM